MKLLLVLENHFSIDENGIIWCNRIINYDFLKRYLQVFDEVVVCGRAKKVEKVEEQLLVTGERVKFVPLPEFVGAKGLLKNLKKIKKKLKEAIKEVDCVLYRAPTHLSLFTYREVLKNKKVLALEFMMAANKMIDGNNVISKIFNFMIDKMTKVMCKKANAVSYVTEKVLQEKYPCMSQIIGKETDEYFTASYSTIELNKENIKPRNWDKNDCPNKFKIIHTGFMDSYRKGQDILIKALKELIDDGFVVDLTLIGDGKKRTEFEKLAKDLGIEKNVFFVGLVKDKQKIFEYLEKSHLLVFPTESEGLPRTVIEAMAVGLPCISSPVDGIVELLDSNYLVKNRNYEEYAKKMKEILGDWNNMIKIGNENYNKALKYEKNILDEKRKEFYKKIYNLAELKVEKG